MSRTRTRMARRAFLQAAGMAAGGALLASCQKQELEKVGDPVNAVDWARVKAVAEEGALVPQGSARGIFPGRVTWSYHPGAAAWDGKTGLWWDDESTSLGAVREMLMTALRAQTGQTRDDAAWDALFRHFNAARGNGQVGYQPGQKIAVKVNLNNCGGHAYHENGSFIAPQLVQALLEQLVQGAGVKPADITVYDAIRYVPDCIFDRCQGGPLAGVHFADWTGGGGREKVERDPNSQIHWSEDVQGSPTFLPTCVTEASYLINLASLKGHNLAGVTLTAKNHFGSILSDLDGAPTHLAPQGANLHATVAAHDFNAGQGWAWPQRPMRTYNALVDLIAHPDLGGKTLLFLLDGLYAAPHQNAVLDANCRWESAPFNGGWTSSLFLAEDGVALDSVGLDFLWAEPTIRKLKDVLPDLSTADSYLHEAALLSRPPSGLRYAAASEKGRASLGIHEHWQDAGSKKYSLNLRKGAGIELVNVG